ncbi:MAG: class I SAM-dependent methyltransferase [Bdellovibrionota bacterium]
MTETRAPGLSTEFTQTDHEARSNDPYALSKYRITLRWFGNRIRQGCTLVNIGCGGGYFHTLLPYRDIRIQSCEPDTAAFELARASNPSPKTIDLFPCGLFELKANLREKGDLLVMHDVLEHIDNEASAVDALTELVRPDGRLVISVPAMQWLFGLHDTQLGHFRRYTKSTLARAVSSRFEVVRMRYFGFAFIPLVLWFSVYRRKPYPVGETKTLASRVFALLCRIEEFLPLPLGTSLICELKLKG